MFGTKRWAKIAVSLLLSLALLFPVAAEAQIQPGIALLSFVNLDYNNGNIFYLDEFTVYDLETDEIAFATDFSATDEEGWDPGLFSELFGSGSGADIRYIVQDNMGIKEINPRREGAASSYSRVTPSMEQLENSEVVMRFRVDDASLNQYLRVWIQSDGFGSGSSFARNGYGIALHYGRDELTLQQRISASTTALEQVVANVTTGWMWLRLRAEDDKIFVKLWNEIDGEPEEWTIEYEAPQLTGLPPAHQAAVSHELAVDIPNFSVLQSEIQKIAADLGSNIAVYVDASEGVIAINEELVMSSASIIKVPILVECLRQAEMGSLFWDDVVLVQETDVVGGSGDIKNMAVPRSFTVVELVELMISVSDNTATNIMARSVGFDEINRTAIRLGTENTLFQNSLYGSMPQDRGPRNLTNPKDMVAIIKGAMESDCLSDEGKEEFVRIMRTPINARLSEYKDGKLHGDIITGRKGGSTANPLVRHDVGFFILGDQVIYAAVMTREQQDVDLAQATIGLIGRRIMDYMLAQQ